MQSTLTRSSSELGDDDWTQLRKAPANLIPTPCLELAKARADLRGGDVFYQFDKTRGASSFGRAYAHGGGLLQSAEWIRQPFQPLQNGAAGEEISLPAIQLLERGGQELSRAEGKYSLYSLHFGTSKGQSSP